MIIGQAAGVAAKMAIDGGAAVQDVDAITLAKICVRNAQSSSTSQSE